MIPPMTEAFLAAVFQKEETVEHQQKHGSIEGSGSSASRGNQLVMESWLMLEFCDIGTLSVIPYRSDKSSHTPWARVEADVLCNSVSGLTTMLLPDTIVKNLRTMIFLSAGWVGDGSFPRGAEECCKA